MIFVDPEFNDAVSIALEKIPESKRPIIIKCNDDEFINLNEKPEYEKALKMIRKTNN